MNSRRNYTGRKRRVGLMSGILLAIWLLLLVAVLTVSTGAAF